MLRKNKKQGAKSAPLTELESALKAKIEKTENINDPVDRLLAYKALRDATEGTFDQDKADKRTMENFSKAQDSIEGWGMSSGVAGGVASGFALASVLTGGLAAIAIIPGVAVFAGATFAGHKLGKKSAQHKFNNRAKKLSPEKKQATNMFDMTRDMDKKIKALCSDLSAIAQSPRREEVKAAFPAIAAEFNRQAAITAKQAEIAAKQAAFLGQTAPSAAGLRIAKPAA